jgi:hypothetical protein
MVYESHRRFQARMWDGWAIKYQFIQFVQSRQQSLSRSAELSQDLFQRSRVMVCFVGLSIRQVCHGELVAGSNVI